MKNQTAVRRSIGIVALLLGLTACATTPQTQQLRDREDPGRLSTSSLLTDVGFFPQQAYNCGPAALATMLEASGVAVTPDDLVPQVYLPARQGSLQIELLATTRRYGRIAYVLAPSLESLLIEVQHGRPVLVMQNLGLSWYPRWHYAVVTGFDLDRGEIILNSGQIEHYVMSFGLFERTWQRSNHWAMVVLNPGELPVDADELAYLDVLTALATTSSAFNQPDPGLETAYLAGLDRWPNSIILAMGLGNLFYEQGRMQKALHQFAAVVQAKPDYAPAHNNLAQVLLELGRTQEATSHARKAVSLGGTYLEVFQETWNATQSESTSQSSR